MNHNPLDLYVESRDGGWESPLWLTSLLDQIKLDQIKLDQIKIHLVTTLPVSAGALGLDRRGMLYHWQKDQVFRLDSLPDPGKRGGVFQACGQPRSGRILDACAGFGQDTLTFGAGVELTLVEQSVATSLFLHERLELVCRRVAPNSLNWHALCADAVEVIGDAKHGQWDVIYLDPMFPARKKGALPKIEAQVLAQLQSAQAQQLELNEKRLLDLALTVASKRVVVKRRRKDPLLLEPNLQLKGSKVRFDIYFT